jgi:hypothetical protein
MTMRVRRWAALVPKPQPAYDSLKATLEEHGHETSGLCLYQRHTRKHKQPVTLYSFNLVPMAVAKTSLCIAYTLWLCMGWFGAHLYYVERYGQAFVACHTGCLFGIGWLYDGINMARYVEEANGGARST